MKKAPRKIDAWPSKEQVAQMSLTQKLMLGDTARARVIITRVLFSFLIFSSYWIGSILRELTK